MLTANLKAKKGKEDRQGSLSSYFIGKLTVFDNELLSFTNERFSALGFPPKQGTIKLCFPA